MTVIRKQATLLEIERAKAFSHIFKNKKAQEMGADDMIYKDSNVGSTYDKLITRHSSKARIQL